MVLGKVATEAVKIAITYGGRFARYDKAAWNKLYTGFPKYVKKGTREGFIAGSSIGGFISGIADDSPGNGKILQPRKPFTPSKPYKARYRQPGGFTSKYSSKYNYRTSRGCTCPSKHRRSYNR